MSLTPLSSTAVQLIVIGASAGGVEAVGRILGALPSRSPIAVAIVLHLPPDRPSTLASLFASQCALPVKEAEDKEDIAPGTIYIAPPNYHLLVEPDQRFSLSVEEAILYSRPSIDLLFESAAYAYGDSLLAVVLTGASSDGAEGLALARRLGSTAWVQDPGDARARAMPQAAVDLAQPDRVIPLSTLVHDIAALMSLPTGP